MSNHNRTRHEILSGERIFFSVLQPDDISQLAHWTANDAFAAQLGDLSQSATPAARHAWFAQLSGNPRQRTAFAVLERASAKLLGTVALYALNQRQRSATLGIGLVPDCWGRGYGSEAVRLMVEYGFYQLQLSSINLMYVAANERGQRAYRRAGFHEVGRLPQSHVVGGQRYDTVLMSIASDDVDLSRIRAMLPLLIIPQA